MQKSARHRKNLIKSVILKSKQKSAGRCKPALYDLCFFLELVVAAAAGDRRLPASAGEAKKRVAFGAFKVFIFFAVFNTRFELTEFRFPIAGQGDVLLVFGGAFLVVFGKHSEDCPDVESETKQGQNPRAKEKVKDVKRQPGEHGEHAQVIRTVTALHELGQTRLDFLPERHRFDPLLYCMMNEKKLGNEMLKEDC